MSYTAKDIQVLEGLEPVRKRPGMYIGGVGSAGLHHLVWEILDNSIDEAMNGHASTINVTLHDDGSSVTITDDGRTLYLAAMGSGKIARKGTLSATLPVRVKQELGNGDLYVEGTKVVMVGEEEHHIYLSGIVRTADIADDNTVPSSRIADAEIEYTGRGDVSDQQRRSWGSRLLARVWPW